MIRDDDQNNRDDNDDGEFVAMTADELEDELAEGDAESIDVSSCLTSRPQHVLTLPLIDVIVYCFIMLLADGQHASEHVSRFTA